MTEPIKDVFHRTLPDYEPPMRTQTGDLLARGRRKRTMRNLQMVGGATLLAVVTAAAALTLPNLSEPATPAPAASQSESDEVDGPYPPGPDDWWEYSALVEDVIWTEIPDLRNQNLGPFLLEESGSASSDDPNAEIEIPHSAEIFLETADGTPAGSMSVALFEPGPWTDEISYEESFFGHADPFGGPLVYCWSGTNPIFDELGNERDYHTETECAETVTVDDDRMVTVRQEQNYDGAPVTRAYNAVVVFRSDGTAVMVSGFCGSEDEDEESGQCHDIQVSLEQLTAIALQIPAIPIVDDGQ